MSLCARRLLQTVLPIVTAALINLGISFARAAETEALSANGAHDVSYYHCDSSRDGVLAAHIAGTLAWNEQEGVLSVQLGAVREVLWRPSEQRLEGGSGEGKPPSTLDKEARSLKFSLARQEDGRWRVIEAKEEPDRARDDRSRANTAALAGRPMCFAFFAERYTKATAFDTDTVSEKAPFAFEETPFVEQRLRGDPDGEESASADLVLVHAQGLEIEVAAVHRTPQETRGVVARIWAGGSSDKNRRQLADEGVRLIREFLIDLQSEPELNDRVVIDLLNALNTWRTDIRITAQVISIKPKPDDAANTSRDHAD